LGKCIKNIIPHAFGNHSNCQYIGGGNWCKAMDPLYIPKLPGGKYLGYKLDIIQREELKKDLEAIMAKFTTNSMLEKLAPCGSTQINESIHGVVGSLASKRLFFGRSHQWKYRNAMAGLSKSLGPNYGLQILGSLNIKAGLHTKLFNAKIKLRAAYQQHYKKKSSSKIRRNKLKALRKQTGKKEQQKEGIQYESGCGLTEILESNTLQKKRKNLSEQGLEVKKRRKNIDLEIARTHKCSCGKGYTTSSNLLQHKKKSNHL
jgi:hypothetical protein